MNVAIWEKDVPFNFNNIVFGEKKYHAGELTQSGFQNTDQLTIGVVVLGYLGKDYEGVIKSLASGDLKPEKMITSKIAIDRVVEDGFEPLINQKEKHVKILVDLSL